MLDLLVQNLQTLLSLQATKAWIAGVTATLAGKYLPDVTGFDEGAWLAAIVTGAVTLALTFLVPNKKPAA